MRTKNIQDSLRRQLNAIKREQFPWMLEAKKNAPQMPLIHLGDVFGWFYPVMQSIQTFKKLGIQDRFTLVNDQFAVNSKYMRVPYLEWVRIRGVKVHLQDHVCCRFLKSKHKVCQYHGEHADAPPYKFTSRLASPRDVIINKALER